MKKIVMIIVLILFSGIHIYADDNEFMNKYIILAVKKGEVNTVQLLLQQGADPNTKDDRGNTLLMLSVTMEYQDIFELLLSKGADTTLTDAGGRTPLLLALFLDKFDFVKYFLSKGYIKGINIKDGTGKSPLMIAVAKGYGDIVNQLIELGANIKDADNEGVTPLMYAVKLNHTEIADMLLQRETINNVKVDSFVLGSYIGDGETIKGIIDKSTKENLTDEYKIVIIAKNIFLKKIK